jgi:hypothetical protein
VLYYLCFLPQKEGSTAVYGLCVWFFFYLQYTFDVQVTSLLEGLKFEANISACCTTVYIYINVRKVTDSRWICTNINQSDKTA